MNNKIFSIAKKEFLSFFTAPIAYIFLGTFILATYYIFFWVDKFFARNIADLRPLFNWMPILLIFLVATITMRMWSEERRMGTLEFLLTAPVKTYQLVFGKFLACLFLVLIALVLTISLPVSVSLFGDLDWGPVIGAYLAALFLAAGYIAIGLFISSKSDNQIVSLILTIVVGSIFYLIGSNAITGIFSSSFADIFKALGSGARFESISRGIIDFRDLYYYLTLVGVFLALNIYTLEALKWSNVKRKSYFTFKNFILFVCLNLIIANIWLVQVRSLRLDITEAKSLTLSDSTKSLIGNLQEPLLIRGYFSKKTHPLLAPLIPQLTDVLQEYQYAGKGKIVTEIIDPKDNEELEEEAGRRFSIKPTPLQISDKYQASLVNAYFDVVIVYGDKFEILSFRDLIEVNFKGDGEPDIRLRNAEYDLTRAIKKAVYGFQSIDNLFDSFKNQVKFTGYITTKENLPQQLASFTGELEAALEQLKEQSNGKFSYEILDPKDPSKRTEQDILEKYGFKPMIASLFDTNQFYYYMLIEGGNLPIQVALPEELTKDGAIKTLEASLKRVAPGFLKTVGLVVPKQKQQNPYLAQMGIDQAKEFNFVLQKLSQDRTVKNLNLSTENLTEDIDILVILAPKDLTKEELYKIDQFLMRGGSIVLSTSPYGIKRTRNSIQLESPSSGLEEWLLNYGVEFMDRVVLDDQNESFPIPVQRNLGGFTVEEIKLVNYPPFVDVRQSGMNKDSSLLSGVPQVTLNWPSPLVISKEVNKSRKVTELLKSSANSWSSDKKEANPNFDLYPDFGFPKDGVQGQHLLGVVIEGEFESYFKGKDLDFLKAKQEEPAEENPENPEAPKPEVQEKFATLIEKSPLSSKLIIFGSQEFLADQTLQMSAVTGTNRYMNSLTLLENAIDWSLEDPALLGIRGKGQFSKTLYPLSEGQKAVFEYLNYFIALFMLFAVWFIFKIYRKRTIKKQLVYTGGVNA